jgi:hypothetical protein
MSNVIDLNARRGYRLNNTPARWQKALKRALEQGVDVRQLATTGVWVATSGTDSTAAYVVTESDCECRAAQEGDCVCKHRALLRHVLGMLPLDPDPTPAAPAVADPPRSAVVEVLDATGRLVYRSDDLAAKRAA